MVDLSIATLNYQRVWPNAQGDWDVAHVALNEAKAASKTKRAGLSEALRRRGRSWDLGESLWPMTWEYMIYIYI